MYYLNLQFPATPAASILLDTTISSITYVDPDTGVFSTWNGDTAKPATLTSTSRSSTCSGLVSRAQYTFRYVMDEEAGTAQLFSVSVALVVTDVTVSIPPASTAGDGVLTQEVQVTWAPSKTPDYALQAFSGLPGYLPGYPVLAGVAVESDGKTAVNRYKEGLLLPGAGVGGKCDSRSLTAVGFGYNISSSCSNEMSLAGLKRFCKGGDPSKLLQGAMRSYLTQLGSGTVLVGVWGNSDVRNPGEWISLAVDTWPLEAMTWDDGKQSCSNVPTGFAVRLLTGLSFGNGEVQSKILFAQLCFTYDTWVFARSGAAVQQYPLTFMAEFVPKQQDAPVEVLKPAPPLYVPLPPDLFYPFLTSGAGALTSVRGALMAVPAALAMLLLLV